MSQKRAARKYKNEVSNRNPWKEPTSSTKKPAPTVPKIAANVPAVFEIPRTRSKYSFDQDIHLNYVIDAKSPLMFQGSKRQREKEKL